MKILTSSKFRTIYLLAVLLLITNILATTQSSAAPPKEGREIAIEMLIPLKVSNVSSSTFSLESLESFSVQGIKTATINVNFSAEFPAPQEAQIAIQYAASIWEKQISGAVPIAFYVEWEPLDGSVLGQSGPTGGWYNFAGAPIENTVYPHALANQLAGEDKTENNQDIKSQINSNISWYYGTDQQTPSNKQDLVTVSLHMIGLGLGFYSTTDVVSGTGKWGVYASDLGAYIPVIYDHFVVNGSGQKLIDTNIFPNSSSALASQMTSNNIFFDGSNAEGVNGGNRPKLYAPSPWDSGSSISHLDLDTYPPGSNNSLMTVGLYPGKSVHSPGPIALGMLNDMGWGTPLSLEEIVEGIEVAYLPNNEGRIAIIDLDNPDIELTLGYTAAETEPGKFVQQSVSTHAVGKNGCAGGEYALTSYRYLKHPFVAINGTAKDNSFNDIVQWFFPGLKLYSSDSVLAINSVVYGKNNCSGLQCLSQIDNFSENEIGIFVYEQDGAFSIKRYGVGEGYDYSTREEILDNYVDSSRFTIGYQSTILDVLTLDGPDEFIQYSAADWNDQNDNLQADFKTILGVSEQHIYMAVFGKAISLQEAARYLLNLGADRAILLDSGSQSAIAWYDKGIHTYEGGPLNIGGRAAPVLNAVVACNTSESIEVVYNNIAAGELQLSPNIQVTFAENTFSPSTTLTYYVEVPSFNPITQNHVNQFYNITAVDENGNQVQPNKPYEIAITYNQEEVPPNILEEQLALYYLMDNEWVMEPTSTVDIVSNSVHANPDHLSSWALLAPKVYKSNLPLIIK